MPVHRRAFQDFDEILRATAAQQQMLAAGCDQRASRHHAVVVGGFFHCDLAQAVEACGKRGGELLRHVLHDHDARAHARQGGEHFFQRLGAAGGGADGHDPLGGLRQRTAGLRRQDHIGSVLDLGFQRRGSDACGQAFDVGTRGAAHGGHQLVGRVGEELLESQPRFGDHGHCAGGQRIHRHARAFFGERGADHHRGGALAHDLAQEGDAIHARHFHIQHDHVRPLLAHFFDGQQRVGGGGDDLDAGRFVEHAHQHLAYHRRIIDHHRLDGLGLRDGAVERCGHGGSLAQALRKIDGATWMRSMSSSLRLSEWPMQKCPPGLRLASTRRITSRLVWPLK